MSHDAVPLLTQATAEALHAPRQAGIGHLSCSLDLGVSMDNVLLQAAQWQWRGQRYPYPPKLKPRTIHYWDGDAFTPVARYTDALIKLVPTPWGPPTFEIDGIKMLPSQRESPMVDAQRKVALIAPHGKAVLDTCGGLGYFAACCLAAGAAHIQSYEKRADVLWLRTLNPWSPDPAQAAHAGRLTLTHGDVCAAITDLADGCMDAALHDPPRISIAGELYAQAFYAQLARVLRRGGQLFHYTGAPNSRSHGRDLPREVARRLEAAGFKAQPVLDGVYATRR